MKSARNVIVILILIGLLILSWFTAGTRFVDTDQSVVALTFDDGPNPPYTEQLLQTLEEKQVKATFFLIGQEVTAHPETARQILNNGHEIGGHSSDWKTLAFESPEGMENKLEKMNEAFASVGITNVALFRPPGGFLLPWQRTLLVERGLTHISANVVVGDWKELDAQTICDRVLKKVHPGSIIALHDGGGNRSATIAAVPLIIDDLKAKGYEFVTVSELLNM
ncbi:polysaccharide deacetylase family protein [Pontiellaceae bacterium B1224]|nr:polysaccharide deacetylase family protein [Pontiellaceae bacterium B1224]